MNWACFGCHELRSNGPIFTPAKKAYMAKLRDLLKALLKNGLKISLKQCQLFKTELQLGSTIFIKIEKCVSGP